MRLISELRRRNVFRMAVLYVVAAWLVMQVAGVLMDLGVLPQEVGPWVMTALAIGFPIALIVSWFFDITPEGVVRDADVSEDQPVLAAGGRRTDFVIIAMLAAAVILLIVWEPPASGEDAMTVLPFESMTGPDEAAFSEGLSIELKSLMAQLRRFKIKNPPAADILVRLSDVRTLSREMDVRWVLKGSVRRVENRVRIAVELIDVDDDASIAWSNVFDRELSAKNLFAIQTEIARSITNELRLSLDEPAEQRLALVPTQNTEAYNAYLLGRQRLSDRRVVWLKEAVDQFALAIELDADFAAAYSGLIDACGLYRVYSGGHQHERCPAGPDARLQLARKAVELDEDLGEAWVSLASALEGKAVAALKDDARYSPDETPESAIIAKLKEAHVAYERGLALNPSYTQGYLWYASSLARPELYENWDSWLEAWKTDTWQSIIKRALAVDPLSITLHNNLTDFSMWAKTKEEALHHARRIIEIAPDSPLGYARLSTLIWLLSGKIDESIRWANRAADIDPQNPRYTMQTSYAYATLGDSDMAMAYWELAGQIIADEVLPVKFHILHALILLGDKGGIRTQQVLDALEPIDVGSTSRMEVEANLALINGTAKAWLDSHAKYLSDCLNAPIDQAYLNMWPKCLAWLDGLLLAVGEEVRARAAAAARIQWSKKWLGSGGQDNGEGARDFVILGENDNALDAIEASLPNNRGNPYLHRLYLAENLRFTLYHDPLLSPIRDHPRFQAIVAEVEADLTQQLDNVREMQRRGEIPTLEELRAKLAAD
jgi:TolB-like protein